MPPACRGSPGVPITRRRTGGPRTSTSCPERGRPRGLRAAAARPDAQHRQIPRIGALHEPAQIRALPGHLALAAGQSSFLTACGWC
jgi:hypothetical protein